MVTPILGNLFTLPPRPFPREIGETLAIWGDLHQLRLERILSDGQSTPPGTWYDQDQGEWVVLLQGKAILEGEEGQIWTLGAGDYLYLPPHYRHRVNQTSGDPPCVWLALHLHP